MTTTILKRIAALAALAFGLTGALSASAAKSAKAVEYSDGRLVFYYDDADHSSDTGYVAVWSNLIGNKVKKQTSGNTVTKGVFDSSFANYKPTSMLCYFYGLDSMTTIQGWEYLDTSSVVSFDKLFRSCKALTSVDLSRFDTSNVTDMSHMFYECWALTEIDLASFRTTKVTDVECMFYDCRYLEKIYATPDFDVSLATTTSGIFHNCLKLTGGNGTAWKKAQKDNAAYARIDGGPTSATPGYFTQATRTLEIATDQFPYLGVASAVVKDLTGTVIEPTSEEDGTATYTLDYGTNVVIVYTADVGYSYDGYETGEDGRYRETGITADATIEGDDILSPLEDCELTIDTTGFASQKLRADGTFVKLSNGLVVQPTEGVYVVPYGLGFTIYYQATDGNYFLIRNVDVDSGKKILDSFGPDTTFAETGIQEATEFVPSPSVTPTETKDKVLCGVVTPENTRKMTITYNNASPVGRIYVRGIKTDPSWLFDQVDFTNVVVDSSVSGFVPSFKEFYNLFYNLSNVTEIVGLEYLDTSTATTLYGMFQGCRSLTSLDLHHFRTPKVEGMQSLFFNCSSLETIDITRFSSAKVTACANMFRDCPALKTIYTAADFDLTHIGGDAAKKCFSGCSSLVGGAGTSYATDPHSDAAYARMDGGPASATPGYFSPRKRTGVAIVIR